MKEPIDFSLANSGCATLILSCQAPYWPRGKHEGCGLRHEELDLSLHLGRYEVSGAERWFPLGLPFLTPRGARSALCGEKAETLGAADKAMEGERSCSLPRPPRVPFPGRARPPLGLRGERSRRPRHSLFSPDRLEHALECD